MLANSLWLIACGVGVLPLAKRLFVFWAGLRPPFWLRGQDSNLRPPGYEPDELPLLYPATIDFDISKTRYLLPYLLRGGKVFLFFTSLIFKRIFSKEKFPPLPRIRPSVAENEVLSFFIFGFENRVVVIFGDYYDLLAGVDEAEVLFGDFLDIHV